MPNVQTGLFMIPGNRLADITRRLCTTQYSILLRPVVLFVASTFVLLFIDSNSFNVPLTSFLSRERRLIRARDNFLNKPFDASHHPGSSLTSPHPRHHSPPAFHDALNPPLVLYPSSHLSPSA